MRRPLIILTALAVLGGAASLLVSVGPRLTKAGASETGSGASRAVAGPPAVALEALPGAFEQPVFVTAPAKDRSRLFVVEKTGRIRIIKDGAVLPQPFLDISARVSTEGERGLLSMAFDPRYARNGRFYVNYTNLNGDTRVVRYRVSRSDPDRAAISTAKVLLRIRQPHSNHNGGQLQFGPDGRLYVGMGDGGGGGDPRARAQNDRTRLGKMLRITLSVSPVKIRAYAKGLRNPWRFSFDRATGALWIGDVGRDAGSRSLPGRPAGANFGWNGYEGTLVYDRGTAAKLRRSRLTWPVAQYGRDYGASVTGGYVYRGGAIPDLRGFYLFGDFVSGRVWAKKGPGGARNPLPGVDGQIARISSFGQDAAGELYVVSLNGAVYRIVPAQ